jgi:CRISPR-associated protein Csm1
MQDIKTLEIVLGGMLHDVGKFFQRSEPDEKTLSGNTLGLENSICPVVKGGRYSHRHVLFSSEFCSNHLDHLPVAMDRDFIHGMAAYHHRPADAYHGIIQEADWLSSALDRKGSGKQGPTGLKVFRKTRLVSVIQNLNGHSDDKHVWEFPLKPLSANNLFPEPVPKERALLDRQPDYRNLWQAFLDSWKTNTVKEPLQFVNKCLAILEKFTWCIPSDTRETIPDVSLYDHLKTTAAIAACLLASTDKSSPFILLVSDFSGIQSYIFDIKAGAGGLAKRLRARSFFVDLANTSMALEILNRLSLPLTNCLTGIPSKKFDKTPITC